MYKLIRSEDEINDLLNEVAEVKDAKGTKFRGMTYEDGIESAIRWLLEGADYPMND